MASANTVIEALKLIEGNRNLDRYNGELCQEIQKSIDAKLKEKDLNISERSKFARNNFMVMNKWRQLFPTGISECLEEYFRDKALWSPRFDPRFPNQNQTKNCFVNFVDYQRCLKYKGADFKDCDYFKQAADALCPNQWLEKYNEQLHNGSFPVDF